MSLYKFHLRPVTHDDAGFIIELRQDDSRNKYLNPVSSKLEDQLRWLDIYFERPGDFYFIIEDIETRTSHGAVGIYNFDPTLKEAEWGRWIIRADSTAALETACMIYDCCFFTLDLAALNSFTIEDNVRTVAFHDRFGVARDLAYDQLISIGDKQYTTIHHRMTKTAWLNMRDEKLSLVAKFADSHPTLKARG
ncbi:MAG: GNAT family N-acetyltransferase [Deltaproteobacteria bacterium]|nr:GNAT family N-acetyltransferase [Deltaproteobacteria bacterium]